MSNLRLDPNIESLAQFEWLTPNEDSPSFAWKIEHAYRRLKSMETAIAEWLTTDPWKLTSTSTPGQKHIFLEAQSRVPIRISLMFADFLHNLRTALDQYVFDLAQTHQARPLTEEEAKRCAFPVAVVAPLSAHESERRLGLIAPMKRRKIEALQPFGNPATDERLALAGLHTMDNSDKHRILTLVAANIANHFGDLKQIIDEDGIELLVGRFGLTMGR